MGRAPCCDKSTVKKGPWSPEEDTKLKDFIHRHGTGGNWIALPHKAGLKRCGKSCRLRWLNYLRPDIKHGEFSEEEDQTICNLFSTIGSRWSIIAAHLPGRTDNDIKNYWNTKLKKKLFTGIQPTTIPFSDHTIRHACCGAALLIQQFPPPIPIPPPPPPPPPPPLLSISSPLTVSSSPQRIPPPPTLYLHGSGFSYNCNAFPFTEALLPVRSSVLVHGGGAYVGLTQQAPPQTAAAWWEAPLEYGLEDIKELIINGGGDGGERVEGDENKAKEGKEEYL